jgi:hypothetical protein
MKRNIKSLWIAIIMLLFFLCLYLISKPAHCQSIQYQFTSSCSSDGCSNKNGYIAITKEILYIWEVGDSLKFIIPITEKFNYKIKEVYDLSSSYYHVFGTFAVYERTAYLELWDREQAKIYETYYLKE